MIKKIFSLIFVILLLVSVFSVTAFADENQDKAIYDFAELFTEAEITAMEAAARQYFGNTDSNVYVVTTRDHTHSGGDFIDRYLGGKYGNSIVLLIYDNTDHNYNLYTFGKPDRRISDSEVDKILDAPMVYDNIKSGKHYDEAICEFFRLSAKACEPKIGLAILIGCIFAAAAATITGVCITATYRKKSRSEKYPLNQFASLQLTEKQDIFAGNFVTTRVIKTNSGSRSGGSHGGSGGGFRGGR